MQNWWRWLMTNKVVNLELNCSEWRVEKRWSPTRPISPTSTTRLVTILWPCRRSSGRSTRRGKSARLKNQSNSSNRSMIWRKNSRFIANTKMKWELLYLKQSVKMYSIITIQMLLSYWWVVRCLRCDRWKLPCASNPGSKRLNLEHGIASSVKYASLLPSKSRKPGGRTWSRECGLIWLEISRESRQLCCSQRCGAMRCESATGTILACAAWRDASNSSEKCSRTYRKALFCT